MSNKNADMPDWSCLSLELAERASQFGRETPVDHGGKTFINVDDLDVRKPARTALWWWPFIPLLKKLLENGGCSLATSISLAVYKTDEPRWINFLCEDYSDGDYHPIEEALEYFRKTGKNSICTMTELLDEISRADDREKKIICIKISKTKSTLENGHILHANWDESWFNITSMCEKSCRNLGDGRCTDIGCYVDKIANQNTILYESNEFIGKTAWHASLTEEKRGQLSNRLRAYIGWLGYPRQHYNGWDTLLTIPAQLRASSLPGTHCGAIHIYVREGQWISALSGDDLVKEIGSFASCFWAGSTVLLDKDIEQFKQAQQQLEKQAQMLKLLQRPLDSLTGALERTQQDTQMLRSILYDPHKALFSISALVSQYFEQGRQCRLGPLVWEVQHKPASYVVAGVTDIDEKKKRAASAAATVIGVVLKAFGVDGEKFGTVEELYAAFLASIDGNRPEFDEYRMLLSHILWGDDGKGKFIALIRDGVYGSETGDNQLVITAIERLKDILFTPFKIGAEGMPLRALAVIFYGKDKDADLTVLDSKNKASSWVVDREKTEVFKKGLPVLSYSKALNFVSGVVDYMKNRDEDPSDVKSIIYTANNETDCLEITFNKKLELNSGGLTPLHRKMTTAASDKAIFPTEGDFYKPFVDFAYLCSGGSTQENIQGDCNPSGNYWKYRFGDKCLSIVINDKSFSILVSNL